MLFPVLQRFYGGTWETWEGMPVRHLNCYIQMLPVIKAEESLRAYQAVVLGNGPKSKRQVTQMRRQVRELKKTMERYSGKAQVVRPKSKEEFMAMMASLGIRIKEAPARA